MKIKYILLSFLIYFFYFFKVYSFTLTWITDIVENSSMWNWWRIVFPDSINWVFIDASDLLSDNSSDIYISWNFWIQNASSSSNLDYWWATFDIWSVVWAPNVVLSNNMDNTFSFEWYAWSRSTWWIYFWDTWVTWWEVIYNRTTWIIDWCSWSQNLWWLCFDNFVLDTTPPDLSQFEDLSITPDINTTINIPSTDIVEIKVENWDSVAMTTYNTSTFTHDFRKAKDYIIIAKDVNWNISNWVIKVVAWVPSLTLEDWWIWVTASPSEFTPDIIPLKEANWIDEYEIRFKLRDKYWNPILNVEWIKDVKVEIWFDNNVDVDQVANDWILNAITYSNNQFSLISWNISNFWTWYSSNWDYSIDISSLAPTKEWYNYTTINNDISISSLKIIIDPIDSNTWVWEWIFEIFNPYINKNLRFTPSVYVNNITNLNDWNIIRDVETSFTWEINIDLPNNVSDIKITHLLDTLNLWIEQNLSMSFQELDENIWWKYIWYWNNVPNDTNTDSNYECDSLWCSFWIPPFSSNLISNYPWPYNTTETYYDSFNTILKLVLPWLLDYDIRYSSIVEFKNNWTQVKFPSYTYSTNDTIINNQVQITWIVTDDFFSVIEDDTTNKIWDISKAEVYANIKKNIVTYQNLWTWVWSVYYTDSDYILNSWPSWIDTIIVDWWDLTINTDIVKLWTNINSIVVLKWDNDNKWNIWIKDNVSRIEAIMVTDKALLSWNWVDFYDENTAINQLFIKWSVLSYNTIWWSSSAIPTCPYYIQTCDYQTAKKYDLNNLRYYINWVQWLPVPSLPLKDWYDNASFIIEYDPLIQTNIPDIFLLNN